MRYGTTDTFHEEHLKANYGGGYSTLMTLWVPKLRYAGVNDALIAKLLMESTSEETKSDLQRMLNMVRGAGMADRRVSTLGLDAVKTGDER